MMYTHVLNRGAKGVESPADFLAGEVSVRRVTDLGSEE